MGGWVIESGPDGTVQHLSVLQEAETDICFKATACLSKCDSMWQ